MNEFVEIPASKKSLGQRKLVYGVGVNDAKYLIDYKIGNKRIPCPYYKVWQSMLERCYSLKYQANKPTYIGCTVCVSWHTFSNFKIWMEKQNWIEHQLDKDLLVKGNKVYSPETCLFVSSQVNSLLNECKAARSACFMGVYYSKNKSKFCARCSLYGKQIHLGTFDTEHEAHKVYCEYKASLIREIAEEHSDIRVKNALIERANTIHLVE